MKFKHTPGPWKAEDHGDEMLVLGPNRDTIAQTFAVHRTDIPFCAINAERIVACVNACESIADPSVVPEMLDALKAIIAQLDVGVDEYNIKTGIRNFAERAIARAEGRT